MDVWQGSKYASELAYGKVTDASFLKQVLNMIKVTDDLLAKNQEERATWTFELVERTFCWTELIHKFSNLRLRSQTPANVIEIFQNTHHVDLYFR